MAAMRTVGRATLAAFGLTLGMLAGPALADCTDPPIPGVNYQDCVFDRLDMRDIRLVGARLRDATFIRADLTGSDLSKVEAYRTKFLSATLKNVNFDGAKLFQTDFSRADLEGASFVNADLRSARFYSANLRGVDLTGAQLRETDFTGADLSGATWTNGEYVCREGSVGRCN